MHILIFVVGDEMTRLPIQISDECLIALRTYAKQEHRDARQQAVWIIEQALERKGLLESQLIPTSTEEPNQGGRNDAD